MKLRLILILVFSSIFSGCPMDRWYSIRITNNSSKDIMVLPGYARYGANEYPDTTLPMKKPVLINVRKNDYNFLDASFEWGKIINDLPSDTLSIFYFEADSINNLTWERIRTEYIILKRDDLSLSDLELKNWALTFD
jgi:hypothetical protein